MFTLAQFQQYLKDVIQREGTQGAVAEWCGISQSVLSKVVRGTMRPPKKLLKAVGVCRLDRYEFIDLAAKEDRDDGIAKT